ncbi:PE-PPE domain-containing protein [Candidatus Mycolicibacterium alkanivorans]|uniref:PE-PPE domain-containing protein n=1 Tax=Candidatus Mycolicibacterium alkanivorans TaxID=2954114 RepID=A0ABS9YRP0_9MYCO|nr:PE-PPE domain-containing protein [Candidatus Mycolicibacterium alkanivorans]MCI4673488.1 PE-PPE domain-containing protein [Candidatus Mycolicibacterium alkanivorans]
MRTRTVTAVVAAATASVVGVSSAAPQARAAVVTPGSATNWDATGIDKFYGLDWNTMPGPTVAGPGVYGPTAVATFHLLQDYIQVAAIDQALKTNPVPNGVVSSGRGAGNASALISQYAMNGDPTLQNTNWLLDNNIDRPNGGYASRYPAWSIVNVNPLPTPTDTGAPIIDVGYEYAWNSDVPAYALNLVALLNSITEYAYRYRKQDVTTLPAPLLSPDGKTVNFDAPPGHYIVETDSTYTFEPLSPGNTTIYVTYKSKDLAMLRPLRDVGGAVGNLVADAVEPVLTVIVNAGYPDNNPVSPPEVYTPFSLLPPPKVVGTALHQIPGAVQQGVENVKRDLGIGGDRSTRPSSAAKAATASTAGRVRAESQAAKGSSGTGHTRRD